MLKAFANGVISPSTVDPKLLAQFKEHARKQTERLPPMKKDGRKAIVESGRIAEMVRESAPAQPPSPRSPLYGNYVRTPVNLANLELGQSLFSMPQAAELFPPAALNPNDLESFRRSTVTKTLVRDLHAELYRLRDMAARKRTELSASEVRGRVEGVEWVLSRLESYYMPESDRRDDDADDSSSDPAMTVEFDA